VLWVGSLMLVRGFPILSAFMLLSAVRPSLTFLRHTSQRALVATSHRGPRPVSLSMSTSSPAAKRVLVPVADGSEEIESVTIIDTLVRGGEGSSL
jgi:hypothetical protein